MITRSKKLSFHQNCDVNHNETKSTSVLKMDNSWTKTRIIYAVINVPALCYIVYSIIMLISFVSGNKYGLLSNKPKIDVNRYYIFINSFLLAIFIIPHSVLANDFIKSLWSKTSFEHFQRTFYLLITGFTIQVLTSYWSTSENFIWNFSNSNMLVIFCQIVHMFSWIQIIAAVCILDFAEFLGIKHIFYTKPICPYYNKTINAQRFFKHGRHPTVMGLVLIFWFVPVMSMDRLILASVLSAYLFSGSKLDDNDYNYAKSMYVKKHKRRYG